MDTDTAMEIKNVVIANEGITETSVDLVHHTCDKL